MGAVEDVLFFVAVFREFGVPVDFEPGWDRRGNGSTAAYEGGIVHHTAIPASYANPGPGTRVLRDGRPDLSGPLCQYQGLFNGRVRVIAAHPANHAGASGGPSMGPLPVTNLFNPRVQGIELDYAGNTPMSPEQYHAAKVFAIAVKRRYGDIERCRLHAQTSREGKWDAGWAPGRSIDAAQLRRDALALEATGGSFQEDDMTPEELLNHPTKVVSPGNPNYAETPQLRTLLGDVRFQMADTYRAVVFTLVPALAQIAAAVTDGDLDQETVLARIDTAVRESTAQTIAGVVLPALQDVLTDALGEDNEQQAEEIVTKLGERLRLVASDGEQVA